LFGAHLAGIFKSTFDAADSRDKARLDFLLSTWERRAVLCADVLDLMRRCVGARLVTLNAFPAMQGVGPVRKFGEVKPKPERGAGSLRGPPSAAYRQVHGGGAGGNEVRGFVGETLVSVSLGRAEELKAALRSHVAELGRGAHESSSGSCKKALARLSSLLDDVQVPPPLPPMLFGVLPVEPSKEFKALAAVQHISSSAARTSGGGAQAKIPMPKFRTEHLERDAGMKEAALQALMGSRPFVSRQDGQRFKTEIELAAHLDALFARNRERTRVETMGKVVFRPPFCQLGAWVTDFNKLKVQTAEGGEEGAAGAGAALDGLQADEERVLLADEYFTRCPVSKEVFEDIWDYEDGDIYYRNAVKILLAEVADPQLFKNSRPTSRPSVRYCIVHKSLVLDGWLEAGRATVLRNAVERYQAVGQNELAADLLAAAGADEAAQDDVFVLLGLTSS
jgi:hypothetical protein